MKININTVFYYQAEFYFFHAKYQKALNNINFFLKNYSSNVDARLLRIHLLYLLGDKTRAWQELEEIQQNSKRLKIWMLMSKLVESLAEFKKMEQLYLKYKDKYLNINTDIEIQKYISNAAASIKMYDIAEEYLKNAINLYEQSLVKKKYEKKYFSKYDAMVALEDLSNVFALLNIDFFLVSGTFLGCIREKSFISTDYDIDIGVWEQDYSSELKKALEQYGTFYIHDPKWKGGIKLKHINGILIDIFIHYKEGQKHYHLGSAVKWYNSTFDLIKYQFLNKEYFGFKEYDRYLSENYGDWRVPKKNFDNILDTPNAVVFDKKEYRLHLYKLIFKKTHKSNKIIIKTI
ncbi:LicD family protein [Campylobacter sp. VicNov18]|uniref:tetratricopeptide repeat protein n=1 Tax=Campylobacter bilis TaxID=2691918 RepID=UPI001E328105|nr:LicD family protein [Campylobacter bilis]MCC8278400.1 LicD family protein [Campylobacter bilis]MCC8299904.1 LicD family protein [Campylobacter bilis]MCC8301309.1 LicD family protein [Campylobacter bilis]MCC8350472.1 LicD family protein [Campylobacter bilis]MCC8356086.1 LicD family protein [Campylobacter bilis]